LARFDPKSADSYFIVTARLCGRCGRSSSGGRAVAARICLSLLAAAHGPQQYPCLDRSLVLSSRIVTIRHE
jgi:hypothetical protein